MSLPEYTPLMYETASDVTTIGSEILPSGAIIKRVEVFDESQESPTFSETRQQLDVWNEALHQDGRALPPLFDKENGMVVSRNAISERFYQDTSIQEWALLMPSARALFYLTHLDIDTLPSGQTISDLMARFMCEMDDGIGIRTRKRVASDLVAKYLNNVAGDETACLSLACGAADLMLETIAAVNKRANLTLVDIDDDALSLVRSVAAEEGLRENDDFTIKKSNLIYSMVRSDELVQTVGEGSQLVVDAIGINEYFSTPIAAKFLANAYRCVQPGGSLITANMLSDRPQMLINRLAIGWTSVVKPRSINEITEMIDKAGLPLDHTTITIPEDGIYAVIEITKPSSKSQLYAQ